MRMRVRVRAARARDRVESFQISILQVSVRITYPSKWSENFRGDNDVHVPHLLWPYVWRDVLVKSFEVRKHRVNISNMLLYLQLNA